MRRVYRIFFGHDRGSKVIVRLSSLRDLLRFVIILLSEQRWSPMNVRSFLASLVVAGLSALQAAAGPIEILEYNTEAITTVQTVSSVPSINDALGVTDVPVTRGSAVTPASASFSINSSGWFSTLGNANANYQFGFTTTQGYHLTSMTLGLRSSATGPGLIDLQYQANGSTTWVQLAQYTLPGTNFDNITQDLSSLPTITSGLLFRLIVDPASGAAVPGSTFADTGTFRFGSFEDPAGDFLNPEMIGSAVPEPSSMVLFALSVPTICIAMRRRYVRVA
jgi:hypothetical protein